MPAVESNLDPLVGRLVGGKFEIDSLLGRGGMGAVYRARQKNLRRPVAIKVLRDELLADPTYAARFKREAYAASQLDHPNLMRVIDFGEDDGLFYLAMELVDGRSLLDVLHVDGPLSSARVVDFVAQLLAGLAVMHEEGIVHRDLKPENVMVVRTKDDDGRDVELLKLCDFGIAKQIVRSHDAPGVTAVTETTSLTATGALVGTPDYMSPEQARGEAVGTSADLYSVGVILYQLLTGRLPFASSNGMRVLLAHISEAPPRPSMFVAGLAPALEAVCLRALAKTPEGRFASAREMRGALRAAIGLRDASTSMAPPAPRVADAPDTLEELADTQRGSDLELARALADASSRTTPIPPSSTSGIVARPKQASTLASGAPPSATPTVRPSAPALTAASPSARPRERTVSLLVAVVVVLLVLVAVLAARR